MHIFLLLFNYALWSSVFALGKITLSAAPPLFVTGSRMFIAGVLLLAFLALFRPKDLAVPSRRQWLSILGLSFFSVYLANALEFWGLQYLTAAKTCLIYSLTPFLSAILSYFQFGERISRLKIIGLALGFSSFLPILLDRSGSEALSSGFSIFSWAEVALMLAAASAAYGWILLKSLGTQYNPSPITSNAYSMLLGGAFALMQSCLTENWSPLPIWDIPTYLKGTIAMIVISNIICYNLYGWLLKRFSATFTSFAGLATPLFAASFGYLILGEKPTPYFFIALAIIVLGMWLVYKEESRLGYIKK